MTSNLADTSLCTAIARRRPAGTVIVHSDRGGHFRSLRYPRTLRAHGLTASMGRVAAAGDNAAMEPFFALLQKSALNRRTWHTRDELHLAIATWIERTYHGLRRQRALGKLTPIEFEAAVGYSTPADAACSTKQPVNQSLGRPHYPLHCLNSPNKLGTASNNAAAGAKHLEKEAVGW